MTKHCKGVYKKLSKFDIYIDCMSIIVVLKFYNSVVICDVKACTLLALQLLHKT